MNDKGHLESLLDFKDIKKQKANSHNAYSEETGQESIDNEAILRSFKDLRQKLKVYQKENAYLKQELKIQTIRVKQNQEALESALSSNIELKDKVEKQVEASSDLRKRLAMMKQQIQKCNSLEQELAFNKQALLQARLKDKAYGQQKKKTLGIYMQEKIQLEQEICRLRAKSQSDLKYISHLEEQSSKTKEKNIRLQNQMRKMSLNFEENSFNQHFANDNFQTKHLKETVIELEAQISSLKNKLTKQKDRRHLLEDQLIFLEESAGINNVKANTFEGQTEMLSKKQGKLEKKLEDLLNKLQRSSEDKVYLEQLTVKYQTFSEELLMKLKPLVGQDMFEILQYYENKLKTMINSQKQVAGIEDTPVKSPPIATYPFQKEDLSHQKGVFQQHQFYSNQSVHPFSVGNYQSKSSAGYSHKGKSENLGDIKATRFTFGQDKQNDSEFGIEAKIRRERNEMEKKIKEKWFQKRFQSSLPSQLYKLRAEYITTFIDK